MLVCPRSRERCLASIYRSFDGLLGEQAAARGHARQARPQQLWLVKVYSCSRDHLRGQLTLVGWVREACEPAREMGLRASSRARLGRDRGLAVRTSPARAPRARRSNPPRPRSARRTSTSGEAGKGQAEARSRGRGRAARSSKQRPRWRDRHQSHTSRRDRHAPRARPVSGTTDCRRARARLRLLRRSRTSGWCLTYPPMSSNAYGIGWFSYPTEDPGIGQRGSLGHAQRDYTLAL